MLKGILSTFLKLYKQLNWLIHLETALNMPERGFSLTHIFPYFPVKKKQFRETRISRKEKYGSETPNSLV